MLDEAHVFSDVSPGTVQQFAALLIERLAVAHIPEMAGMVRLYGRWTDPGRPSGKYYYGAKVVDDGGAQVKVEVLCSLVDSRGIAPGQHVVLIGRLMVRASNFGVEVRLVAADIQLGDREEAADTVFVPHGRMTLERLRGLPLSRVPFPEKEVISLTLIQSTSVAAQVARDCMAELVQLGDALDVASIRVNMLDPVAIASAIRSAVATDVVMLIRGGGDAADFEVFDDPRVVMALANQRAHRIVGLGHTGNSTLLDLVADHAACTPAQAAGYVRECVQLRQRRQGEMGRDLRLARDRMGALEKERDVAHAQLAVANDLLTRAKGISAWAVVGAFMAGAALVWIGR